MDFDGVMTRYSAHIQTMASGKNGKLNLMETPVKCSYCKKPGHTADKCFTKQNDEKRKAEEKKNGDKPPHKPSGSSKFNKDHTHRAWRFHPAELAKRARAARKPREQREAPGSPEKR